MARRRITDRHGDRWEVEELRTGGDAPSSPHVQPASPSAMLGFRNPETGLEYEAEALRPLEDISDEELREELHRVRDSAEGSGHGKINP